MIKHIRNYIAARRRAKERRQFQRGFGWAMTEYFYERTSIEKIESYLHRASAFGEWTTFDDGARQACRELDAVEKLQRVIRDLRNRVDEARRKQEAH